MQIAKKCNEYTFFDGSRSNNWMPLIRTARFYLVFHRAKVVVMKNLCLIKLLKVFSGLTQKFLVVVVLANLVFGSIRIFLLNGPKLVKLKDLLMCMADFIHDSAV